MKRALQQRIVTGAVLLGLFLAANFGLSATAFLVLAAILTALAAHEFARIVRPWAPSAPFAFLPVTVLLVGIASQWLPTTSEAFFVGAIIGWILLATLIVLATGSEMKDGAIALGLMTFAIPYFALPVYCLYRLQKADPWWVILLVGIVATGDSAAYFIGSKIGRRKLAPTVSPNKTLEGSGAGFLASLLVAALWSHLYLGRIPPELLAVAALTALAGQLGDLLESLFKRGAGVKDSAQILPGHGGFYDRLDALILATPVFLCGLLLSGIDLAP